MDRQWYHIYLPVQIPILDNEFEFSKERFQNLFSPNNRYHSYYVLEVFMQFAERYLTSEKFDLLHRCGYTDCMVRIPDTYNIDGLHKGLSLENSQVKIIRERDGI